MRDKISYFYQRAEVTGCVGIEGSDIFYLYLECPEIASLAKPGQFVVLSPLDKTSEMPRPFSIYSIHEDGRVVGLAIRKLGKNTALYAELKAGDKIGISGPHGIPFPKLDPSKKIIFVAGGMGVMPLQMIAEDLKSKGSEMVFTIGAKTDEELSVLPNFGYCREVRTITEKDGFATDLLRGELAVDTSMDESATIIIACGPMAMLKKVAEIAKDNGNPCYVVIEEVMACGVGSCKGCAVFGIDGTVKHVCTDGPTFDAAWIDWEKISINRLSPIAKTNESTSGDIMKTVLIGQAGQKIILSSPIMNAAGCLDVYAIEDGSVDITKAGALVTKGVELFPRNGNPSPRVCETDSGMINSIGLENPGVDVFIKNHLPRWLAFGKDVIVNVSGRTVDEYVEVSRRLNDTDIIAEEVNISCPNIKEGGMIFGVRADSTARVVEGVRKVTDKFLIVKLSPNVTDILPVAVAAFNAGADAVSLINTLLGMRIDIWSRRPMIMNKMGGLSGPAIRPLGVRFVSQIAPHINIPIIGMGGIDSGKAAAEYVLSGADTVAIGTALFKNPNVMTEAHDFFLKDYIPQMGVNHFSEIVGALEG